MKGASSSRKIEELCRENLVFRWLLKDQNVPDHCTVAYRLRSAELCKYDPNDPLRKAAANNVNTT